MAQSTNDTFTPLGLELGLVLTGRYNRILRPPHPGSWHSEGIEIVFVLWPNLLLNLASVQLLLRNNCFIHYGPFRDAGSTPTKPQSINSQCCQQYLRLHLAFPMLQSLGRENIGASTKNLPWPPFGLELNMLAFAIAKPKETREPLC